MKVEILNQKAGASPVYERIKELISGRRQKFDRIRILMALARWSGLGLVGEELKDFVRSGGRLEVILGTDLGGTTPEVLSYLLKLAPRGSLLLFGAENTTFHPKVLIFESPTKVVALIGSSNLTGGGLAVNFEVDALIELDPSVDDDIAVMQQLEALWRYYSSPSPPLGPANIIHVDQQKQIEDIVSRLGTETGRSPDERPTEKNVAELFPRVNVIHPPRVSQRPTAPGAKPSAPKKVVAKKQVHKQLYMQVLKETGPEGAQVQVPVDALAEFFGVAPTAIATVALDFPDGKAEHRHVLHFANNTHRIQIAHLVSEPRPLMIRFTRLHGDNYRCDVAKRSSNLYKAWFAKCDRQTRTGSKHWGVE